MSASEKLPRPPQVTLVGWLIVVGSLFVVFSAFETLGSVRSMESLQRLEEFLDDGPGASLGWTMETGVQALRVASTVTAACAAAAAVLGWFVLRRHHGARIAVTVLAVPLFLSGAATGGFVSSMVAAAAVLLWLQPSRDWFNGIPCPPRSPAATTPLPLSAPPATTSGDVRSFRPTLTVPTRVAPGPWRGSATRPVPRASRRSPPGDSGWAPTPRTPPRRRSHRRPYGAPAQ